MDTLNNLLNKINSFALSKIFLFFKTHRKTFNYLCLHFLDYDFNRSSRKNPGYKIQWFLWSADIKTIQKKKPFAFLSNWEQINYHFIQFSKETFLLGICLLSIESIQKYLAEKQILLFLLLNIWNYFHFKITDVCTFIKQNIFKNSKNAGYALGLKTYVAEEKDFDAWFLKHAGHPRLTCRVRNLDA